MYERRGITKRREPPAASGVYNRQRKLHRYWALTWTDAEELKFEKERVIQAAKLPKGEKNALGKEGEKAIDAILGGPAMRATERGAREILKLGLWNFFTNHL